MKSWAEHWVGEVESATAVCRYCRVPGCTFKHLRRKGGMGRGAGFKYGNKQRGLLIQHVKQIHPELEAQTRAMMEAGRALRS